MSKIQKYPVRFYALVVALLQLATAFGLSTSAEQNAAIMAVVGAGLAMVAESFTTPTGGHVSPDS